MKKLLAVFLLLSSLISWGQYINVRINPSNFPDNFSNSMWNNWKMKGIGYLRDTSSAFIDMFGNQTTVRAIMSNDGTGFDNGVKYSSNAPLTQDSVLRKGIYISEAGTVTLTSLNDSSVFSISLYASRDRTDSQSTIFSVGNQSITILTDKNLTKAATFNNIAPTKGKIVVTFKQLKAYGYLNGFQIVGVMKHPPITAKLTIDSTIIHYPNSYVRVTDVSTGKGINVNQWFMVSGPKSAIFTPVGTGTNSILISGLVPGTYKFGEIISDSLGNTDSTTIGTTMLAAICQTCPPVVICPVCPVIPPPRTVTGITWTAAGIKFTYSDGKP
jgi:hypothetical protein